MLSPNFYTKAPLLNCINERPPQITSRTAYQSVSQSGGHIGLILTGKFAPREAAAADLNTERKERVRVVLCVDNDQHSPHCCGRHECR